MHVNAVDAMTLYAGKCQKVYDSKNKVKQMFHEWH